MNEFGVFFLFSTSSRLPDSRGVPSHCRGDGVPQPRGCCATNGLGSLLISQAVVFFYLFFFFGLASKVQVIEQAKLLVAFRPVRFLLTEIFLSRASARSAEMTNLSFHAVFVEEETLSSDPTCDIVESKLLSTSQKENRERA